MKVALVQVASPPDETESRRRQRVAEMVLGAVGADLVVLPELWAVGYFSFGAYRASTEALSGPTVSTGAAWARALGCHVHVGSFVERGATGTLHNTAALLDPEGRVVHTYRKLHVFGYQSREVELLTPGDNIAVAPTTLGPLSATTCYDLRFPELYRSLVELGAQMVVVPAAWPRERLEHWRLLTACRALENQFFLVACNAVGQQAGGVVLGGHSRVVTPWGDVVTEASDAEGVTMAEVDLSCVDRVRNEFPVLADRRILPAGMTGVGEGT